MLQVLIDPLSMDGSGFGGGKGKGKAKHGGDDAEACDAMLGLEVGTAYCRFAG